MNGTHRFLIHKHYTDRPHYDFKLRVGEIYRSWIIPSKIPQSVSERRLAIENNEKNISINSVIVIDDHYGIGEAELWDSGCYEIIEKNKEKIILDAKGDLFSGCFVLLVPSWGRWNKKKVWLLIKTT